MKKILIFGPPGIGKSTICRELSKMGYASLDLETVYGKNRKDIFNAITIGFIAAANLSPKLSYSDTIKVLLVLPQEEYEKRRFARDCEFPNKSNQPPHKIKDWYSDQFDYIIKADDNILNALIEIYNTT